VADTELQRCRLGSGRFNGGGAVENPRTPGPRAKWYALPTMFYCLTDAKNILPFVQVIVVCFTRIFLFFSALGKMKGGRRGGVEEEYFEGASGQGAAAAREMKLKKEVAQAKAQLQVLLNSQTMDSAAAGLRGGAKSTSIVAAAGGPGATAAASSNRKGRKTKVSRRAAQLAAAAPVQEGWRKRSSFFVFAK
jgi:hypothetical protein